MTDVIVFHHAQGLTPGVLAFADELRAAGHRVVTPDLYEGATFHSLRAGIDHAERIGNDEILARGAAAANLLPSEIVYIGFSLGVMPAQTLAQTRAGARGAVLIDACVPFEYTGPWPRGLPLQLHAMDRDAHGDVEVAREVAGIVDTAELYIYPGDQHLFADSSLASYVPDAASLLVQRVKAFLLEV